MIHPHPRKSPQQKLLSKHSPRVLNNKRRRKPLPKKTAPPKRLPRSLLSQNQHLPSPQLLPRRRSKSPAQKTNLARKHPLRKLSQSKQRRNLTLMTLHQRSPKRRLLPRRLPRKMSHQMRNTLTMIRMKNLNSKLLPRILLLKSQVEKMNTKSSSLVICLSKQLRMD